MNTFWTQQMSSLYAIKISDLNYLIYVTVRQTFYLLGMLQFTGSKLCVRKSYIKTNVSANNSMMSGHPPPNNVSAV